MKHLICAIYEQAIKDYYKYMLGGSKVTNEYDLKCIVELFDSDENIKIDITLKKK